MRGEGDAGDILAELDGYTRTHVSDEQKFMSDCGFGQDCSECFLAHQDAHEAFESEVSDLHDRSESGDATVRMKTVRFLREWLTEHVGEVDQQIGTYLDEGATDRQPREMSAEMPAS